MSEHVKDNTEATIKKARELTRQLNDLHQSLRYMGIQVEEEAHKLQQVGYNDACIVRFNYYKPL